MANFSWESEEDWEEEIRLEPRQPPLRPWRRYVIFALILLSLAGGLSWFGYARVDAVNEEISQEIISSHALIQEAVRLHDRELFLSVLSGRSDGWVLTQSELFSQFDLDSRPALGFEVGDQSPSDESLTVDLDPGLNSATVSRVQMYRDRFGEPLDLQITDVYRLGQTRWLLAPPDGEFWGEWVEFEETSAVVETKFPERDAPYVWGVQQYLEEKVGELCRDPAYQCQPNQRFRIVFHHDPYTLLQTTDPEFIYQQADQIVVPTPTLIGLPLDENGQQLLARAYAAIILPKIIVDLIDYDCCLNQFPYLETFIERQLIDLEVLPALDRTQQAAAFFKLPFFPSPLGLEKGLALGDPMLRHRTLLVADYYIDRSPQLTIGDLLVRTASSGLHWMNDPTLASISDRSRPFLYNDFVFFAAAQQGPIGGNQAPQNIGIVCRTPQEQWVVGRYEAAAKSWKLNPISYEGAIQRLRPLGEEGWVWIDGKSQGIVRYQRGVTDIVHQFDPRITAIDFGQTRSVLTFLQMDAENGDVTPLITSVDACSSGDCPFRTTDQNIFYFWNPAGTMAIEFANSFPGDLSYSLVNEAGDQRVELPDLATAGRVYWEDNDRLIITRQDIDPNDMGFFRFQFEVRVEEKMFNWSDVVAALPEFDGSPTELFPMVVTGVPDHQDHFFMLIGPADQSSDLIRLAIYDAQSNGFPLYEEIRTFRVYEGIAIQGDLRFAALLSATGDAQSYLPTVVDFREMTIVDEARNSFYFLQGEPQFNSMARLSWTADGRWLAHFNEGFATLVDLQSKEKQILPYPRGVQNCVGGSWINF